MVSVTEILETFPEKELVNWKLRMGKGKVQVISEEALRIGKVVDMQVREDITGIPFAVPHLFSLLSFTIVEQQAIISCWKGWQQFKQDYPAWFIPPPLCQRELSREGIIGHPDFFHPGKQYAFEITDLKCANQIRPIYWTQEAGYAWLHDPIILPSSLAILRLDKTLDGSTTGGKGYEYVKLTDPEQIDYEIQIWLNYKQLYEHRIKVAQRDQMRAEEVAYDGVS